jgi:hypothetical protein
MTGVFILLGGMVLVAGAIAVLDWLDRRHNPHAPERS